MTDEPDIMINGYKLTRGQAMTVRVALGQFLLELAENAEASQGLGEDK